jgi:ABC-type lipoprotein export system ATPase subunit
MLFEVKNLYCKYPSSNAPVLYIEDLVINSGALTVFVGPSGVGKSTLLETLGLMTNTIQKNHGCTFKLHTDNSHVDINHLWSMGDYVLSKFRESNYSFIFQNTNLFDNLSCIENAFLPLLLNGHSITESIQIIRNIFTELNLPDDIPLDYPISKWSGGQRQRLSFARALSSSFRVLFADEPTGNLDVGNAQNVISIIKSKLSNDQSKSFSAIIVTHDINLALHFADSIVVLHRTRDLDYGVISMSHIFDRVDGNIWSNRLKNSVYTQDMFLSYLKGFFL